MQFQRFPIWYTQEEKDLLQFPRSQTLLHNSYDGTTWTESNLSYTGDFRKVVAGQDAYVAMSNATNTVSFSHDGESWVTRSLPTTDNWVDIAFGNGYFIMIAEGSNNVVTSQDGLTWTAQTIPDSDDSTTVQWQKIEYGAGRFVAISSEAENPSLARRKW